MRAEAGRLLRIAAVVLVIGVLWALALIQRPAALSSPSQFHQGHSHA